jgi:hypothetical protein
MTGFEYSLRIVPSQQSHQPTVAINAIIPATPGPSIMLDVRVSLVAEVVRLLKYLFLPGTPEPF